ncbi:hypothetical protein Despr_1685 [Desulfobulbus propionicus DSM 2032]|uniref:Prenyltransferase alpha-alpha toroid domain-containing protein n=1 Tax=Desulfobulbus propionicus (strain ATCC 33891 / DSM 2032 / VKM B-1956 / 1pr3) TaxID=577650 RepID=A0A7U3YLY0_DESPD|nr:hypothetical protein [Desulfobulbus propionicus]ADW17837.1 hypothetical protein Despr_1685 [Desulfobulbus propionicus DSM 2032]
MIIDLFRIKQDTSQYILERSCPRGGFCFYRLDEPSPQDTYFALATLDLLQVHYDIKPTIRYLQAIQQPDGGYVSLAQAFFVLSSLHLLERQPLFDPAAGVDIFTIQLVDLALRPADASPSLFHAIDQLATLRAILGLEWQYTQRTAILQVIESFHHQTNGGFGMESSATLPDTYRVTRILKHLDSTVPLDTLVPFLRACEHPVFGFTGKPGTALFFLEYLHAGLALCRELACIPTFPAACLSALLRCQTDTGGFARAHLAIASMDDTYRAIHGLTLLEQTGTL